MAGEEKQKTNDYYSILGVDRRATHEEIREAFKKAVLPLHPDHGGDEEGFRQVQTAYEVLSDPRKRRIFDRYGEEGLEKSALSLFTQEFRQGSFAPSPDAAKDLQHEVDALRRENESLQRQLMIVKPEEQSAFPGSFESWLRNRDPGSVKVITTENLAQELELEGGGAEPEPLPELSTWTAECTALGELAEVVRGATRALPRGLEWGEVVVQMLAAPVSPVDRHLARRGFIPKQPAPAIPFAMGTEGVGQVVRSGPGAEAFPVGTMVMPRTPLLGTWRKLAVWKVSKLYALPPTPLFPESLAQFSSYCTAYRLLEDHGSLLPGDTLIQSNAEGAVGQAVIQLCKLLQIKTINLVDECEDFDEVADILHGHGATHVWKNSGSIEARLRRANLALPRLALDATGGMTMGRLAEALRPESTFVSYGSESSKVEPFPFVPLLHNNIEIRGFWLYRWLQKHPQGVSEMAAHLLPLLEEHSLEVTGRICSEPETGLAELLAHRGAGVIRLGSVDEASALAERLAPSPSPEG